MPLSAARVLLHPPKRYVLSFDGENDYIRVARFAELTAKPYTILMAIRTTGTESYYSLFYQENINTGVVAIYLNLPVGHVSYWSGSGSGGTQVQSNAGNLNDGKWHVLGFVDDYSKIYIYVDGEYDNSKDRTSGTGSVDSDIYIATRRYLDYFYLGDLAFLQLYYDKALTADEIRHNYLNPMNPILDGLICWLAMEEGSGTTVHDKSGNGNDGVIHT